jgi:hypothetical protein
VPACRSGQTSSRRPGPAAPSPRTTVATATGWPAAIAAATWSSSGKLVGSTRSTKISIVPPQVSPTSNASSSLTP